MALVHFPGSPSGALKLPPDDPNRPNRPNRFDTPSGGEEESAGAKMSFLEHLDEFRKRVIYSFYGIGVGVCISAIFLNQIYDFLIGPAIATLPPGSELIYTQPVEPFALRIQIALIGGTMIAAPFIMYQIWKFIAPGLYSNEKRFVIPFVLFSSLGFLSGAAFNHYVAYPFIMRYFASYNTPNLSYMPQLGYVFGLYVKLLLGLGIVFQMPTIVFFMARMKIVTARFLLRHTKYAILIIFVLAAVITPGGDPMAQLVFATPMVALYAVSIVIAWAVGPKRHDSSVETA